MSDFYNDIKQTGVLPAAIKRNIYNSSLQEFLFYQKEMISQEKLLVETLDQARANVKAVSEINDQVSLILEGLGETKQ